MPVRLQDIAGDLGVSLITVSKAVRGMEDISEETRQRVLKGMAELEYRPNMMARGRSADIETREPPHSPYGNIQEPA
jgi:LacI family transcriptional regulator